MLILSAAFSGTSRASAITAKDPDAIVIGQIRDQESANLAWACIATGHPVWVSTHASNVGGSYRNLS